MATMRAKVQIDNVVLEISQERVTFNAVGASNYPAGGSDEDNTYARFTPSAKFEITIANPALLGQFKPGERYFVDFTPVPAEAAASTLP